MNILDSILGFIFPDRCVGCSESGVLLCPLCERDLLLAKSIKEPWIASVFSFKDARVQKLIWLLKYQNTKRVSGIFAKHMARGLEHTITYVGVDTASCILVPIPISLERKKERGYNQSELLARDIVRHCITISPRVELGLLYKKPTLFNQAKMSQRKIRERNIVGSFYIQKNSIPLSSVLVLIDDVTTSGATLKEARAVLLRAGFVHIYAQTAAH